MIMKGFTKCSIEEKMIKIEDAARDGQDQKYYGKPEFDGIWNFHIDGLLFTMIKQEQNNESIVVRI